MGPKALIWLERIHGTLEQLVHITCLHSHPWQWSVCPTAAPRLLSPLRIQVHHSEVSAKSRWQLLHVGVCCKSLTSQVPLKGPKELEIAGHEMWTVRRLVHILPALMPSRGTCRYSGWQHGDQQFVSLDTLKKHLAGRWLATDADVKQALLTSTGTWHWILGGPG